MAISDQTLFLPDESATVEVGRALAQAVRDSDNQPAAALVIYLTGHLGAGKTTLSRGLIQGLGHTGSVKSPTYTLVEPYGLSSGNVYHFDLYRLKDAQELEFLGVEEYFRSGCLCLVEWPERGEGWIPAADLEISLGREAEGRRLDLKARSVKGESLLKAFARLAK